MNLRTFSPATMTRPLIPLFAIALLAWGPAQETDTRPTPADGQQSHFFGGPMLVGVVQADQLRQAPFSEWFDSGYAGYEVRTEALAQFAETLVDSEISIEVFFGTWCPDSVREVPRLMRVLDEVKLPESRVTLYALSDNPGVMKMSPEGRERERRIFRTPTIVVLRDGVELGRVVEKPAASFEEDLVAIVKGSPAPLPYRAEAAIHALYLDDDRASIQAPTNEFLEQLQALGDTDSLWHYARFDLLHNGRVDDAADLLHLFLTLHPDSNLGYRLLAQAESERGDPGAALFAVRRALALDPDSKPSRDLEKRILATAAAGSGQE